MDMHVEVLNQGGAGQGRCHLEVRFERRLEGGEGVIHPNRCLGQGDTWQRDQAGVAAPG